MNGDDDNDDAADDHYDDDIEAEWYGANKSFNHQ